MNFRMGLLTALLIAIFGSPGFSIEAEISVNLYNNPAERVLLELPYRVIDFSSEPQMKIAVKANKAINSKARLLLTIFNSNSKRIYFRESELAFYNGSASQTIILDQPLKDPFTAYIKIKSDSGENEKKIPIDLVRLSGSVKDFDGKAIPGAWVITLADPLQIAKTDANGSYSLQMPPSRINCVAAMSRDYPFKQLENYVWNLPLQEETYLDFKLGQAEVFRLMADVMPQNKTVSGSFVAWSCSGINAWAATKKTEKYTMDDSFFEEKYFPDLDVKDVKFFLDGIEIEKIALFQRCDVMFPPHKIVKNGGYRFEFHYPGSLPVKAFHELRIELSCRDIDLDGSIRIEKGQGSINNLLIFR